MALKKKIFSPSPRSASGEAWVARLRRPVGRGQPPLTKIILHILTQQQLLASRKGSRATSTGFAQQVLLEEIWHERRFGSRMMIFRGNRRSGFTQRLHNSVRRGVLTCVPASE